MEKLTGKINKFVKERDWEQFHSPKNLSMALAIEAAEIMEHFQWLTEAESRELSAEKIKAVSEELGDTFIYLLRLADVLKIDLLSETEKKLNINADKYPADKARGNAKKYTEL